MIRDLGIIIGFILVILLFFVPKGTLTYKPASGTIYDVSVDSAMANNLSKSVSDTVFSNESSIPTMTLFSSLSLPDKFIVNITKSKNSADYFIVGKDIYKKDFLFVENNNTGSNSAPIPTKDKKTSKLSVDKSAENKKPLEPQKPAPQEEEPNFYNMKTAVKNSVDTYYFADKTITLNNVTLSLLSSTPYKNKYILKFTIKNDQGNYFFIGSTELLTESLNPVQAQFFNEQYIQSKNYIEGFLLFNKTASKNYILKVVESGKENRIYNISFKLQ